MALTLEDIARLSGFSRSTISRVINGDPNVSPATRQQVMDVIQRNNYQPNAAARGLAAGRTRILGLVIPIGVSAIFTDPFFPLLIQGISSGCNAHDYSFLLWMPEPENEQGAIHKFLYNGQTDGIIVSSILTGDPILEALAGSSIPYVLIGRHPSSEHVHYVDADNLAGAREAVLYLLRLGHQRIAAISGPSRMVVGIDRYQGYLSALHDRGLPLRPELVVEGDFTSEGGYQTMQRLLPHHPDAVFAASDAMAVGAMRAIQDAGLSVPEDISVIGFDDVPFAHRTQPPLTTIRQPIHKVGATAAETLIDIIENPDTQPRHVVLATELVVRDSTAAKLKHRF